VIPCFRQAHFLAGAIESVVRQTVCADEIIVVDDGGEEDLAPVIAGYPPVLLVRQENRGPAAARNSGLRTATSDKVIFLDADDRLVPGAIRVGLECFAAHPDAGFVYGAHEEVRDGSRKRCFDRAAGRADLVRFNCVGMIASAMLDRAALLRWGGFDETVGMCEDWEAFLRLSRNLPFAVHDHLVASYIKHPENRSNDVRSLKRWIATVREREKAWGLDADEERAWREGAARWDASYPEYTPGHLARRLFRRAAATISGQRLERRR